MNKINTDVIENLATNYILNNKDWKNSNILQYPLRVYIDNSHINREIVVTELELSVLESLDLSKIEEYFFSKCDFKNEYLVIIVPDKDKSILKPFILINLPDKSNI